MLSCDYLVSSNAALCRVVRNFYLFFAVIRIIKNTSTSLPEIQEKQVSGEIPSITD